MAEYRQLPIAPYGLGSSFTDTEMTPRFCTIMRNRFVNSGGGAEKRRGMVQLGGDVPGTPNLDRLHEYVYANGTARLMPSSKGKIFALDTSAESTYTAVYVSGNVNGSYRSAQMDDKLIFVNGVDRNIFTTDGSSFSELKAFIIQGIAQATASAEDTLFDTEVPDWIGGTDVATNDLLFDATTSAYAFITNVASAKLTHTPLSAAAVGFASGKAAKAGGNAYEIHDLVELNVVPIKAQQPDNVATLGNGTTTTQAKVSGVNTSAFVDWTNTELRVGDYLQNTTRNQGGRILTVNASAFTHTAIAGQVAGDTMELFKSAMPIASDVHVHYGRAYYVDARDQRKVRISGPGDPQDMTTQVGTLDSITFKIGDQQPGGDNIIKMASFQQYFVMAGHRNIYLYSGTNPVADTTADVSDFKPQSLFPQGLASPDSLVSIGNDIVFLTPDGMQSAGLRYSNILPTRQNLSEAIKETLRGLVRNASETDIRVFHYPRRSWVGVKIGSLLYVFNYSVNIANADQPIDTIQGGQQVGSWSLFDGKLANQTDFYLRKNFDLVCCGPGGKVYRFDDLNIYADAGEPYSTEYETAFYALDDSKDSVGTRKQKAGVAIMPTFQVGADVTYTWKAVSPYQSESGETVVVSAAAPGAVIGLGVIGQAAIGGSPAQNPKFPLRWRGEKVQFNVSTNDTKGPDILTNFTIVFNRYGVR